MRAWLLVFPFHVIERRGEAAGLIFAGEGVEPVLDGPLQPADSGDPTKFFQRVAQTLSPGLILVVQFRPGGLSDGGGLFVQGPAPSRQFFSHVHSAFNALLNVEVAVDEIVRPVQRVLRQPVLDLVSQAQIIVVHAVMHKSSLHRHQIKSFFPAPQFLHELGRGVRL